MGGIRYGEMGAHGDPERNGYTVLEGRDKNQTVGTQIAEDGHQKSLKANN